MVNKSGETAGFVAYNTYVKAIVIVFRGTLPWAIKDWIHDINFLLTPYPLCNHTCQVHRGFYNAWLELRD